MISRIERKLITESSYPFASAVGKKDFETCGYREEEFFFDGTANVYHEIDDGKAEVLHPDIPYCNRYLLRYPKDMSRFSGRIVLEVLNATAKMDIDRVWVLCGEEIMHGGDIYVGITSKPDVLDALWNFDPERYHEISWRVPYNNAIKDTTGLNPLVIPSHEDCETGLIWDMLTDISIYLRKQYGQGCKLILSGWSQSVRYIKTYLRHFDFKDAQHTLFDGYFAAGGVGDFEVPLCQQEYTSKLCLKNLHFDYLPVPFVAVQTETENARNGGSLTAQPDSDFSNLRYRRYEIAGATHDTKYSLLDYYAEDPATEKIGMTPQYMGTEQEPNDFPSQFVFAAIYRLLCQWVSIGVLPPTAPRIAVKHGTDENCTDIYGNTVGGIRTPFIDVPVCTYYNYSHTKSGDRFYLFGYQKFFTRKQIKELYGDMETYLQKVTVSCDQQIKNGFLRMEDRDAILKKAIENANQAGLM